jgi:hypothetical protein
LKDPLTNGINFFSTKIRSRSQNDHHHSRKNERIVLTGLGKHELQEIPVPKPGPFEVLSKVRAARSAAATEILPAGCLDFGLLIIPSLPVTNGRVVVSVGEGN